MAASSILSISSIVFLAFLRSHNTTAAAARKHSSMITIPVLFIFCHPAITDSIDGFNVFLCTKLIPQTLNRNRQSIFIHIFCAICPDPVYKVSTGHGSPRFSTCNFYSDSSGYYACSSANFKLYVCCFIPGDY